MLFRSYQTWLNLSLGLRVSYLAQLGSQQLVFIGEVLVIQQELAVHLGALRNANLERGSVRFVGEDSSRVILT